MAKKQTNDDLLTGGSLSAETKSAKKTKSGGAISIAPQTSKIIKWKYIKNIEKEIN